MPNDPTPWLTTMSTLDGTDWSPADGKPNPKIQGWLRSIAAAYPSMATYCDASVDDAYFPWCGLTLAYCMTTAKYAPVFGATETTRFLYAAAWLGWGDVVTGAPQRGDVLIFNLGAGDHHVTLFEKDNGDGTYSCHGGNQSHTVNLTNFPSKKLMGARRPTPSGALPQVAAGTLAPGSEGRAVAALQSALASQGFDTGGIDGEFGSLTSAAVSGFQRVRNLPVTGSADPDTLRTLGVTADASLSQSTDATGEPTMQPQSLLSTVVNALIAKKQSSSSAPQSIPGTVDINQLLQSAILALAGNPSPPSSTTGSGTSTGGSAAAPPPVLSVIDQIFGGQALAGKKTLLAVVAYVVLAILQATGVAGTATGDTATPAGQILTTLIAAFAALGGAAKVDRLTQAVSQASTETSSAQK